MWQTAFVTILGISLLTVGMSPLIARDHNGRSATGETVVTTTQGQPESTTVAVNQSRVIKLRTAVARVSVANPEIADLLVLDPQQIYVVGKKIGTTNIMLWDDKEQLRGSLRLEVTPDLEELKTRLHQIMPNEKIQVRSAQGTIVVSGEVSSPSKVEAAVKIAEGYAGTGGGGSGAAPAGGGGGSQSPVLNMIQVGGSQQVMLEVKIAEITRDLLKRLDVNFSGFYNGGGFKMGTLNPGNYTFPATRFLTTDTTGTQSSQYTSTANGTGSSSGNFTGTLDSNLSRSYGVNSTTTSANGTDIANSNTNTSNLNTTQYYSTINQRLGAYGIPAYGVPLSQVLNSKAIFAQFIGGNFLLNSYIDAAKNQGMAKILAEPNLTTLSGQEAKFLAGGQYPYATLQSNPGAGYVYTTEFKDYGIGLNFIPVVLDSGVISLKVNVTASELDYTNYNRLTENPGLRMRNANATVEIKTGETISIAGLISEDLRNSIDRFPGLGDIPILGILFRSQEFKKRQTELVIFVTPRLARAFDPQKAKLPTENFVEPNDLEFYLLGRIQGHKPQAPDNTPVRTLGPDKTGSEGTFGHDLP
jgi:pilus assembly protein CpaC